MKNFGLIGVAGYIAPRHLRAIKDTNNNLVVALDKSDTVGIMDSYFPNCSFYTEFESRYSKGFDVKKDLQKLGVINQTTQFATDMEKDGFLMVEVRQGMLTLSEPTKDIEALVLQKRIITNKNPVLTWAVSNAIAKTDANENKMLDKSKARFRIDPAAAMIISHTLARIPETSIDLNEHILSEGFGF